MSFVADFEVDSLTDSYAAIVRKVLDEGDEVSPRGLRTRELRGVTILIHDPSRVVPIGTGRKLRLEIGAAESVQLIAGLSDAAQLISITKNFTQFVESDRLRGAYGPRTYEQFPRLIELLGRDPDTRQACALIWRPWDNRLPSKDIPCTLQFQFFIRNGRLDMIATMRSNDVFWGLPYDAWMFTNLQHAVAYALAVDVGWYLHQTGSLHAYVDRDLDALNALHEPSRAEDLPPMFVVPRRLQVDSGDRAEQRWARVVRWARTAAGVPGRKGSMSTNLPASARWYQDQLQPHHSDGLLCNTCRYVLPRTDEHYWQGHQTASSHRCRRCSILIKYDLGPDDYQLLLLSQDGLCGICQRDDRRLVIDHDHRTGEVRGLLCRGCNVSLGMLDDGAFLQAAQTYLQATQTAEIKQGGER